MNVPRLPRIEVHFHPTLSSRRLGSGSQEKNTVTLSQERTEAAFGKKIKPVTTRDPQVIVHVLCDRPGEPNEEFATREASNVLPGHWNFEVEGTLELDTEVSISGDVTQLGENSRTRLITSHSNDQILRRTMIYRAVLTQTTITDSIVFGSRQLGDPDQSFRPVVVDNLDLTDSCVWGGIKLHGIGGQIDLTRCLVEGAFLPGLEEQEIMIGHDLANSTLFYCAAETRLQQMISLASPPLTFLNLTALSQTIGKMLETDQAGNACRAAVMLHNAVCGGKPVITVKGPGDGGAYTQFIFPFLNLPGTRQMINRLSLISYIKGLDNIYIS